MKLGDLDSICKKSEFKPAYITPPSQWKVFGEDPTRTPCTEDTMVWQFSMLVFALYTKCEENPGTLFPGVDERALLQNRLAHLQNDITAHNFPNLPISKFKEVFDLDMDNLQKNRVRLKNLFSGFFFQRSDDVY